MMASRRVDLRAKAVVGTLATPIRAARSPAGICDWSTGALGRNSGRLPVPSSSAALLRRVRLQDAAAIPPVQALRMATTNGAKAVGVDHLVGSLEPGKRADLIVLDLRRAAHNVAVHDIPSHLVHCARPTDVTVVMVDGRVVLENREILGMDEPSFLADAQAKGENLVRRLAAA